MSDQDGFEIRGVFYPWAKALRPIDAPLIVEVTGMEFNDFLRSWQENIEKVSEAEERGEDVDPFELNSIVVNGLIAAAIWQQNPGWTRQRAFKFFAGLDQEDIDMTDDDEEDRESDPLPVDTSGSSASGSSSTTVSPSNDSPESPSEKTPPSTGPQVSATTSPDLRQVV